MPASPVRIQPVSPAVAAALLFVGVSPLRIGEIRRPRPALVIRCAPPVDPSRRTTTPLEHFDAEAAATAWIAELRGGAVRR